MENNCQKFMNMLSAHIDGELSPTQEQELAAHLQSCPGCKALLESYKQINADSMLTDPPKDFAQKVMEKLEPKKKKRIIPFRHGTLAAAMVALVILGASGAFGDLLPGRGSADSAAQAADQAQVVMANELEKKADEIRSVPAAFAEGYEDAEAAPEEEAGGGGEVFTTEETTADAAPREAEPETALDSVAQQAAPAEPEAPAPNPSAADTALTGKVTWVEEAQDGYTFALDGSSRVYTLAYDVAGELVPREGMEISITAITDSDQAVVTSIQTAE